MPTRTLKFNTTLTKKHPDCIWWHGWIILLMYSHYCSPDSEWFIMVWILVANIIGFSCHIRSPLHSTWQISQFVFSFCFDMGCYMLLRCVWMSNLTTLVAWLATLGEMSACSRRNNAESVFVHTKIQQNVKMQWSYSWPSHRGHWQQSIVQLWAYLSAVFGCTAFQSKMLL